MRKGVTHESVGKCETFLRIFLVVPPAPCAPPRRASTAHACLCVAFQCAASNSPATMAA